MRRLFLAALIVAAAANAAAGPARLRILGYADMKDMLDRWNAAFRAAHPEVDLTMELPGTRAAPLALARGQADVAPMGAELTLAQKRDYRALIGREPFGVPIARASLSPRAKSGPLVVMVNDASPIARLSDAEVVELLTTGRLHGRAQPLCGLNPGTVLGESFRLQLLGGRNFAPAMRGFAESDEVAKAVAADPALIGYARVNALIPGVRVVASYERYLYLFVRDPRAPLVRDYLEAALSPAGQAAVARTPQAYRPLTPSERASSEKMVADAADGLEQQLVR